MSAENFKVAISRQLRDPSSGINCLLHNFEGKDVVFGHRGLGIKMLFLWGETVETKNKNKVYGHQVVFNDCTAPVSIYLDSKDIDKLVFMEETIIFGEGKNSGKITFCLQQFKLERNGFEFKKKYLQPQGLLHPTTFDINDFRVKKYNEGDVTSKWSTESNRAQSGASGLGLTYMDYKFDKTAQDDLKNFLNKNGVESKETLDIFHCFEHGIKFGHTAMTGIYRAFIQSSNSGIKK